MIALLASLIALAADARIVVTSGVNGDLARPACASGGLEATAFTQAVAPAVRQAADEGALALDTGGVLAFSAVTRFAAEREPALLAGLAAALGYRGLFVGLTDLSMPRAPALRLWQELRKRGIPAVATNLRCDARRREVCKALGDGQPVLVGQVALIGILPSDTLARVAAEQGEGLSLEDPAEAIARATRAAHAAGATLVIASVDDRPAATAAGKALELAARLPADARPDLLLSARAGAHLLFARPPGVKPALASARAGDGIDVRLRAIPGGDLDLLVRPLAKATRPDGGPAAEFLSSLGPPFCAAWGRSLAGGHLARPIEGSGLLLLAADAVRAAAHAEVVIVNHGAVDWTFRPPSPRSLSASDVYAALPFDEPVEVGEVTGEWLAARAKAAHGLEIDVLGVPADGSAVNGRPLEPGATYRVATLEFLAEGGDGALPPGPRWTVVPRTTLRDALLRFLDEPRASDPRDAMPDPARSVEWTLRPDLDARFSSSSISNPGGYTAAPLQRTNVLAAGFEANARLAADAPAWLWENAALWHYTSTKTAVPASVTHDDLESFRSTLTERTLIAPDLPQPYLEGYAETEAASVDAAGSRRWLGRGSVGLREAPHPKLVLKLGLALERHVGDGPARTLLGANAQVALAPWEVFHSGRRRVQTEANVDAFIGGATTLTTIRAHAGLTLDLIGPVSLVLAADLYAERDGGGPFGAALDTSAGLRVRSVERTSSF
jgi:hypothetical protein